MSHYYFEYTESGWCVFWTDEARTRLIKNCGEDFERATRIWANLTQLRGYLV